MSWVPFTPSFTTLAVVIAHLNISGPDSNGNYTIFGLIISTACVQSQIDLANKYINSIVPSLSPGCADPREPSAELAATDLACMDILVVSVGGALVGVYDYFLGDMRVARSAPYASSIKAAIAGYQASVKANLVNVSIAAAGTKADLSNTVPRFRERIFG